MHSLYEISCIREIHINGLEQSIIQQASSSRLKTHITMKNLLIGIILVFAVAFGRGQTIELGYPTNGSVLKRGQNFTAEVILPVSDIPPRHEM